MKPALDFEGNAYFRDLMEQPRALAQTIAGLTVSPQLAAIASEPFERIVLTGMGSSLYALHSLHLRLIERGRNSVMVETSELLYYQPGLLDGRALLVAVSQSGRSVEILRLLERQGPRPRSIGVTNNADSPLASEVDAALLTRAGAESTVACKTYLAALAALDWLGGVLTGSPPGALEGLPDLVAQYLSGWRDHVGALVTLLDGVRHVFLLGRGASLSTVENGALILKESTHVHAEGMSCPSFRHGPMEMLRDDVFVLVFAGDPRTAALNQRLAGDIQACGGRVAVAGELAEDGVFRVPPLPVLEMLPVEMMSLALAALAGREPGVFTIGSKVTTTE